MITYQGMTKFLRDKQLEVNIVEGYLKQEDDKGFPPCLRSYSERISILAIARILDGNMILAGCKENKAFGSCTYIEEMEENAEITFVFPVTPTNALMERGKNVGYTIVRVLRCNFVVIGGNSKVPTTTFQLPTYLESICFGLAFARNIPTHHMPEELQDLLVHIKQGMKT
jgi:hypothetical protein